MKRFVFRQPGAERVRIFRAGGLIVPRGMVVVSKASRAERALNRTARERAAAALEADLADVLVGFREGISVKDAEAAVFAGNTRIIVNPDVPNVLEAQFAAVLGDNLEGAAASGVHIGLRFAPPVLGNIPLTLATDAAIAHVAAHGAELALGLTQATEAGIREILTIGLQDGLAPVDMAKRIGQLAGLTPRQVRAVENYRKAITKRLVPVPEALTPNVQRVINQEVNRYRDRKILERGRWIAETETQTAITEGERAFWGEAVASGAVDAENVFKTWRTVLDSRVCEICEPIHGQVVGYGEAFETPAGGKVGPPAHVRCRCFIEWAEADQPFRRPDRGEAAIRAQQNRRFLDPVALREDLGHAQGAIARTEGRLASLIPRSAAALRVERNLAAARATAARIEARLAALEGADVAAAASRLPKTATAFDPTRSYDPGHESKLGRLALWDEAPGVTKAQRTAVGGYTGPGYSRINKALRTRTAAKRAELMAETAGRETIAWYVENVDAAIASSPGISEELTLYRGVRTRGAAAFKNAQVGDEITDRAFSSWSGRRESAVYFSEQGDTVLRMRLPAGTKGLYIGATEQEILLRRNMKYRIVDVERDVLTFEHHSTQYRHTVLTVEPVEW